MILIFHVPPQGARDVRVLYPDYIYGELVNKGDEFKKKCQIDDLNEPFRMQSHFRMLINRKLQMKPYQLHLIFDFLISLLPPGEDVSPIANVVYEYHQSNENQLDINLVLDFIKSISPKGTVLFREHTSKCYLRCNHSW